MNSNGTNTATNHASSRLWLNYVQLDPEASTVELAATGPTLVGEAATIGLVKVERGAARTLALYHQPVGAPGPLRVSVPLSEAWISAADSALAERRGPRSDSASPLEGVYAVVGHGHVDPAAVEEEVLRRTRQPGPGRLPPGHRMRLPAGGRFGFGKRPPWQLTAMDPDSLMPEAIQDADSGGTKLVVVGSRNDPDVPSGSGTTVNVTRGNDSVTATPAWTARPGSYAVLRIQADDLADSVGSMSVSWEDDNQLTHYWYPAIYTVSSSQNRDVVHPSPIGKKTNVYWLSGALVIGPWQDV